MAYSGARPAQRISTWRKVWGENCDTERGLKLREFMASTTTKPIAHCMATALGVSLSQVRNAIYRFKLKPVAQFQATPKSGAVRKHAKRLGKSPTLPPLASLGGDIQCAILPRKISDQKGS
jgi:hypothetical protein